MSDERLEYNNEQGEAQPQESVVRQGRKINMYMTQEGKRTSYVSNATNWGELQSEIGGDFRKKNVVIKEGRHSLKVDSALLPEGDFTLFVYPEESKSGAYENEIKALGYNRGRTFAAYLNKNFGTTIDMTGSKEAIISSIQSFFYKNPEADFYVILTACEKGGTTKKKDVIVKAPHVKEKKTVASRLKKATSEPASQTANGDLPIEPKQRVSEEEPKQRESSSPEELARLLSRLLASSISKPSDMGSQRDLAGLLGNLSAVGQSFLFMKAAEQGNLQAKEMFDYYIDKLYKDFLEHRGDTPNPDADVNEQDAKIAEILNATRMEAERKAEEERLQAEAQAESERKANEEKEAALAEAARIRAEQDAARKEQQRVEDLERQEANDIARELRRR